MLKEQSRPSAPGSLSRSNALLVVIAMLLVLVLSREAPGGRVGAAQAAAPSGGLANPADQRNQMIAELRRLNEQVEAIRTALEKPLKVEVTRMPETQPRN